MGTKVLPSRHSVAIQIRCLALAVLHVRKDRRQSCKYGIRVLLRARRRGRFLPRQLRETSFSHLPTSAVPAGTPSFVVFRMF